MKKFLWLIVIVAALAGCSKEPGSGGTASISGKVKVMEYNEDFTMLRSTYYAQAEDVYLIYGDDTFSSDDVETMPDGSFRFDYLRCGTYRLYVYSADSTGQSPDGDVPVYATIEITKNNSENDLGEIVILKSTRINDGTSTIRGRVFVKEYTPDFSVLIGQYYGFDEDVFIVEGNQTYYSDDVSTNVDGWYAFTRLPMGHYTIYGVSVDSTGMAPGGYVAVEKEVDITGNHQTITLDDIIIFKI